MDTTGFKKKLRQHIVAWEWVNDGSLVIMVNCRGSSAARQKDIDGSRWWKWCMLVHDRLMMVDDG